MLAESIVGFDYEACERCRRDDLEVVSGTVANSSDGAYHSKNHYIVINTENLENREPDITTE